MKKHIALARRTDTGLRCQNTTLDASFSKEDLTQQTTCSSPFYLTTSAHFKCILLWRIHREILAKADLRNPLIICLFPFLLLLSLLDYLKGIRYYESQRS